MARYPGGGGPTDGGGGSPRQRTDEEEESEEPTSQETDTSDSSASSSTVDDLQDSGPGPADSPSGGGSVDDGSTADTSFVDEIQNSGPGPADSPSGGGSVDDGSDSGSADDGSDSGRSGSSSSPPDDIEQSGPGPGDSAVGGGNVDDGNGSSADDRGDGSRSDPPENIQDRGPGPADSTAEPTPEQPTDTTSDPQPPSGPNDVQQGGPGAGASANPRSLETIRQQQWIEENYQRGPTGAGEQISGESGISDEGSPNDPLEGTGLEAGFGRTADVARDIEDDVTADTGTVGGLQDSGPSPEIREEDIEIVAEDGTFAVERARGTLTPQQAQNIDEPAPQDPSQLERQTTSGVTPDYTTAAVNEVEQQIDQQLQEAGIDPDSVDVDARFEDGEIRVGEDVNDTPVRVPTQDADTGLGRAFGTVTAPLFEPFGVDGQAVAGAAGDATGLGGRRLEDLLGQGSDAYQGVVEDNLETGGNAVEDELANTILGAPPGSQIGGDFADLGVEYADEQTEVDIETLTDQYTEGVFQGGASAGNIPGAALGAKEATEYVGYGISETQAGRGGEFATETRDRAAVTAAMGLDAAQENPVQVAGQVGGALAAGAAVGGVTSTTSGGLGVFRAARQAGSRVRSTPSRGLDVGQSAVARAESRTPNVDVTRDPDAPVLEIDPELRAQLVDRVTPDRGLSDIPSRSEIIGRASLARARGETDLSSVLNQAGFAAREGAGRARDTVERGLGTTRDVAAGAAGSVRRAPSSAARNVALEARRVRQRASGARARTEFEFSQARDRLGDVQFTTPDIEFNIDEAARQAGRGFELRRRRTQLELQALGASAEERVRALAGGVPARRDLADTGFRARDQIGETLSGLRIGGEMWLRTRDDPDVDIGLPSVSRPRPVRRLSDSTYRARERASRRLTSARIGGEMWLRTQDPPELPSLENPLGGVSDLTIRVGGSRSSDTDGDEFVADGFDTDEIFGGDVDGAGAGGAGSGPEVFDGETDIDVGGGGGQQLRGIQQFGDDTDGAVRAAANTQRRGETSRGTGYGSAAAGASAMGLTDLFGGVEDAEDTGAGVGTFDSSAEDTLEGFGEGVALGDEGVQDGFGDSTVDDVFGGTGTDVGTSSPTDTAFSEDSAFSFDLTSEQTGEAMQRLGGDGQSSRRFAVPDLDSEEDDGDGFGFGGFSVDDEVFDTGVVQSFGELEDASGGSGSDESGSDGDPWDFDGF